MKLLTIFFLPLLVNATTPTPISEEDKHAQQLMDEGTKEFRGEAQKVNTYIEGIPPIFYKGNQCSQSEAARILGTKHVDINCYFDQDGLERQCTFQWNDIENTAAVTVQTYEDKMDGQKKIGVQTNADVASKTGVAWKDVAATANKMINLYCGADLKNKHVTTHTEQPSDSVNGIPCTMQYHWEDKKEADRQIWCHRIDDDKSLQCVVADDDCSGVKYAVDQPKPKLAKRIKDAYLSFVMSPGISNSRNIYDEFHTKAGNKATTQMCNLEEVSKQKKKLNDADFKKTAYQWLNKNCK